MIQNLLQKMKKEKVLENRYETYVAVFILLICIKQ